MTLQTPDSSKVVVVLTDNTQVAQVQGVFKARRKQMSMAALIPGSSGPGGRVLQRAKPTRGEFYQVQRQ